MTQIIVGAGLAGTLAGLEAERRGKSFVVVDEGAGASATRAAAGLFNPLTGPRFSADGEGWNRLVPFYRDLEQRLGVPILHQLPLIRPLDGAKIGSEAFPRFAPGWSAELCLTEQGGAGVWIEGGGWVDLHRLLDAARTRWLETGRLEPRCFRPREGRGNSVLFCGGLADFTGPEWFSVPGVSGQWQAVRGDVLTVRIPGFELNHGEVGPRFLLPLSDGLYRWGATHESDVADQGFRPSAKAQLEKQLRERLNGLSFEVVDHRWGVRPASRTKSPLVIKHPDQPGWILFNGFGGRGVALVPRWLDKLPW